MPVLLSSSCCLCFYNFFFSFVSVCHNHRQDASRQIGLDCHSPDWRPIYRAPRRVRDSLGREDKKGFRGLLSDVQRVLVAGRIRSDAQLWATYWQLRTLTESKQHITRHVSRRLLDDPSSQQRSLAACSVTSPSSSSLSNHPVSLATSNRLAIMTTHPEHEIKSA